MSEKKEKKSLKDLNNQEDVNFNEIEIFRGETPEDIDNNCLHLCKDYLSGNWTQQTNDTIEVRRISGGFINQLYYCGIREPNNNEGVPQEVGIRLYGINAFAAEDKQRIKNTVISLIFSEKRVGPKIYGLFEGGQIIKFYKHRQFLQEGQKAPELTNKVFKTLAQIHSWNVPIKKDPWWFYDLLLNFYDTAVKKFPINQLIDENNCQTLKNNDLKAELLWIKGVMGKAESPVLFTHNDYRSSNLLITEPNDELVVCDFDLSGYGFRGYDFVSLMLEWGRNQFDNETLVGLPVDDSVFGPLIEIYVEECVRIHGKSYSENPINSVDHILKEVKTFLLLHFLFFTVFMLKADEKEDDFPFNKKMCMQFSEKEFSEYFVIKKVLKEQKIIE